MAADNWTWTAFSLDLNSDGQASWLGFDMSKDVSIKCYVSDELTTAPDFTDSVNITQWATADAVKVDL